MINVLANSLVIAGAGVLLGALIPVLKLIGQLPAGHVRRSWYELTVLIVVLFVGYVSYTMAFWSRHTSWLDFIVPSVFFFSAVFVWLTASLSLQTAYDVRRVTLLEQESITDPLIGIYNRRYLDRRLGEEFGRARRYGLALSVLLIDVDHFKQINDTHGHQAGDQLLSQMGKLLLSEIRDSDVAARYGGDELLILALNTTGSSAVVLAERLRRQVETQPLVLSRTTGRRKEIGVTVSIGVAGFDQDVINSESLVKYADKALYEAKQQGRNRVFLYEARTAEPTAAAI